MSQKISLSQLTADVEAGMKKPELAAKYTGGNVSAITRVLKQAGLKIRSFKANSIFTLVDDSKPAVEMISEAREEECLPEAEESSVHSFEALQAKKEANAALSNQF